MRGKIIKGIAGFYYVHVPVDTAEAAETAAAVETAEAVETAAAVETAEAAETAAAVETAEAAETAAFTEAQEQITAAQELYGRENTAEPCIYECRAKGIFRKDNRKPFVGDDVELEVLDSGERKGNIIDLLPRRNALIRPAVANVDQALVIFAISRPDPNFNLLDRFLISMERKGLPCIVCFNKQDIASEEEKQALTAAYEGCGYPVLFASFRENEGIGAIRELLRGKTTTVAGPSGVGKSSLINALVPAALMETGEVSRKIGRGRNTTRHTQLFAVERDTYILDTPGFSSLQLSDLKAEGLRDCYPEFTDYEPGCRFAGCAHIREPDCAVKQALEEGKISRIRYENYCVLYRELQERKKY